MERNGHVLQVFRHEPGRKASLSADDVRAVLEDQAGHLWVGTAEGLDLLDRSTGQFSHYHHDTSDAESLRDSFVMSLYEDATGLVWIGTRAGGVSRWDPRSWELGGHRPPWLGDKLVTAFADAPNDRVWIASLGGGLVQFDGATGEATDVDTLVGRRNAVGDQRVMSLHQDAHGVLWIGTMENGLRKLTPGGQIESIPIKAGDAHSLSAAGIMTIFEARSGQIWIGTFAKGLQRVDPATGRGVPSNPFYDAADPASARSRVWALGMRNPFRMVLRPETGSHNPADGKPGVLYVGDVGWNDWESLKVITGPARNFGWPIYEGLSSTPGYDNAVSNFDAPNPLFPAADSIRPAGPRPRFPAPRTGLGPPRRSTTARIRGLRRA
jgi:ligand-binding sensor domain-containing protein